jgi:hypothetical protein
MRNRKLYNYIFDKKTILSGYRGSIAHNLHIPREADDVFGIDDEDFFAIYVFPHEYYLSLESYYRSKEVLDEKIGSNDTVEYEIRKAFHLLAQCNPNIISFLWNKPEHYTEITKGGRMLLENRNLFFSRKRIRDAFSGYAHDQLDKLTGGAYKGYMGERRKAVVDKYGYDTKNAATLLRLLTQGIEILEDSEIQVYREKDRDFLIEVKTGGYSLNQIKDIADSKFERLDKAFEESVMPMDNNKYKINELLVEIMKAEL